MLHSISVWTQVEQADRVIEIRQSLPKGDGCKIGCQISRQEVREDTRVARNAAIAGYAFASLSVATSLLGIVAAATSGKALMQTALATSAIVYSGHLIATLIGNVQLWDLRWNDMLLFCRETSRKLNDGIDTAIKWGVYPVIGSTVSLAILAGAYGVYRQPQTAATNRAANPGGNLGDVQMVGAENAVNDEV